MSSPHDVVKSYGRIHLMDTSTPSDEYLVVFVDAEHPNKHTLVGWLAREASALPDVIGLLRSKVNVGRTSQEELKHRIGVTSDANEREHLEYHLRQHEWFSYQFATALQELETSCAVKRDSEF